jgi:chemosensory pili system protein ChpA (sensor histidine kinase/response regulator)
MLQPSDFFARAEIQLEQELCQMFELDSQKDLETYLTCVGYLQAQSWATDLQKMYRAIHTIKGGSVTVRAEAILHVATALEDLLSDLRYLEIAPPLEDGQLRQMLLEGGEILASVIAVSEVGEAVAHKVERIQVLREQIQQSYLADWNEQAQLQREFAEQGFDLVVLDLEMTLEQLPAEGRVPEATIALASQLIEELQQIGQELQLASGWTTLLEDACQLLVETDCSLWRSQWPNYFQALKTCAKSGGKTVSLETISRDEPVSSSLDEIGTLLEELGQSEAIEFLESEPGVASILPSSQASTTLDEIGTRLEQLGQIEESKLTASEPAIASLPSLTPKRTINASPRENIQIPIPLERLERSAQSVVETLLAARATQGFYQTLHHYLLQLVTLAKDSAQYITQLRQIQDDYALLDRLEGRSPQAPQGLTPERYRKGYVTINRLLETSLRLSEIGAEAEQTAKETTERLQQLNRNILKLKDVVEDSRLVPFKNLAFRARAILRDLIDRSGKPAQMIVQGEQIELDVGTARGLEPILLHLIRNAYDHGLEMPAERVVKGKPEQGTLTLSLQRYGSTFLLQIQDDGRGMDAQTIQARAEQLGFPLKRTETLAELLAVICQPGFSSQSQVSAISGRGVGMDVVAEQITRLGGYLSLETTPGRGTTFSVHFPVPHLLVPCLLLQAGDRTLAVPSEQIITTALFESLKATQIADSHSSYTWEIHQDGAVTPALDLLTYWHPQFRSRPLAKTVVAIFVRSQVSQSGIWLLADKMLGQSELQINPLPSPLIAPNGLMGVSLQADGSLMPVLEVNSLIEQLFKAPTEAATGTTPSHPTNAPPAQQPSRAILVVDDAALMRRRIEASLSAYGYTTHTCADGLEALNWLQTNPSPALIITDIEMPNLDGLALIDRCRQAHLTFPILVISSRLAEEWGKEARRQGATDFLTKGFSTAELISRVNTLLG